VQRQSRQLEVLLAAYGNVQQQPRRRAWWRKHSVKHPERCLVGR